MDRLDGLVRLLAGLLPPLALILGIVILHRHSGDDGGVFPWFVQQLLSGAWI